MRALDVSIYEISGRFTVSPAGDDTLVKPRQRGPARSTYALLSVFVLLLLMAGCARPPAPVPAERPRPVPFDIAKLKERANFWQDYQAKFRLKVDSKTSKFSARAFVLIKGRHFVRFETFTPLGQTAALFVSNETGPGLLIPSEKMIFSAQQPETLIRHFIGVTLPFELFRYALAGAVPPEQIDSIEAHSDGGVIHAVSNMRPRWFDWQFTPEGPALSGVYIRSDEFEGRVSYDPPVVLGIEAVPKKIRISSSAWNMEITLEEIMPASEPNPVFFYLPHIQDIRKVDLDKFK